MGSEFSTYSEVLLFPYKWPRDHRRRSSLLWPALAYRVVAPVPRRRRCNTLERAVLSLCRVGLRRAEEIAPRLHIEHDLAAYIARDLQERGCLDTGGALTKKGEQLWLEELEDNAAQRVCHVFQDPESGRLWPFLAEHLPYADRRMTEDGYPIVLKGSDGKPWEERPFVVLPEPRSAHPDPPNAAAILAASRQHMRLRRARRGEDDEGAGPMEERVPDDAPEPTPGTLRGHEANALSRVSLIEIVARPVLLFTFAYAYLPEDGGLDGGLHLCDPFTGRHSAWLLERVYVRANGLRPLGDVLRRLHDGDEERLRERARCDNALRRREAEAWVAERFGAMVHGSTIYTQLVTVAQAAREQELDGMSELKRAAPLAELRKALEQAVEALSRDYPLGRVYEAVFLGQRPHPDRAFVRQHYEEAARQLGLAVPLPRALSEVEPVQLRHACTKDGAWRLRPRLMATLLRAARDPQHPLRRAAQQDPQLLEHINDLMARCSAVVHGKIPRPADLRANLERAWPVLQVLIDAGV